MNDQKKLVLDDFLQARQKAITEYEAMLEELKKKDQEHAEEFKRQRKTALEALKTSIKANEEAENKYLESIESQLKQKGSLSDGEVELLTREKQLLLGVREKSNKLLEEAVAEESKILEASNAKKVLGKTSEKWKKFNESISETARLSAKAIGDVFSSTTKMIDQDIVNSTKRLEQINKELAKSNNTSTTNVAP